MQNPRVIRTGTSFSVNPNKDRRPIPEYDPRVGDHLWNIIAMYRVNPAANTGGQTPLDADNLIQVVGPGCLWCHAAYEPALERMRCPGPDPTEQ